MVVGLVVDVGEGKRAALISLPKKTIPRTRTTRAARPLRMRIHAFLTPGRGDIFTFSFTLGTGFTLTGFFRFFSSTTAAGSAFLSGISAGTASTCSFFETRGGISSNCGWSTRVSTAGGAIVSFSSSSLLPGGTTSAGSSHFLIGWEVTCTSGSGIGMEGTASSFISGVMTGGSITTSTTGFSGCGLTPSILSRSTSPSAVILLPQFHEMQVERPERQLALPI